MNVNKLIINTLSPLGYPVEPITYTGIEKIYITFNYADDRGEVFADDMPIVDVAYMQIHLYVPFETNYMTIKKQIRSKLLAAGFTYPDITTMSENDTKINHIIFECIISGKSETEE